MLKPKLYLFFIATVFFPFVAQAQIDFLKGRERSLNLGILIFIPDYEIEFSKQPFNSDGYKFTELLGGGLRFTSEFKLSNRFSLRFEPGAVINRPFPLPGTYKGNGRLTEIQAPFLLKFYPLNDKKINPYLIGGYLANYKFSEYSTTLFLRRRDSVEFGLGVNYKLNRGTVGIGIRLNEQISIDQIKDYASYGIMETRSLMICLSFDNK